MALLFQVLILPVALHLNGLGGFSSDLHTEDTSECPVGWEAVSYLCNAPSLRKLADSNIHRAAIEEYLAGSSPGQLQLESILRALVHELLFIYDAVLTRAFEKGCLYVHMFALMVSMLRVHLLLLVAGLVQDICISLFFCLRKGLQRLVAPLTEAFCLLAAAFASGRRERPVVPRKVLSVSPISLNASAIRRKEALAKVGLQPEDVSFHAAELNHIQERCHPMRERQGDWWVAEEHGTALAVQRELRWSDSLRLMGVLLPLPCTVLLLEQILENPMLPGALFGACGIFCAGAMGLLSGGCQAWPARLLTMLQILLATLGAAAVQTKDEGYPVLSAALLASIDLRPLSPTRFRGRSQLAAVFIILHLAALSMQGARLENQEAWPWKAFRSGNFCDAKYANLLGLPCGALAVMAVSSRKLWLMLASSVAMMASAALLIHTGRSGLVAAMWWLAACEAVSASWQACPERTAIKVTSKAERKSRDLRISSRQRGSSLGARSGGA
eukprot:symbB.v1.2.030028.t1/scaffold3341.1/size61037/2